MGSEAGGVPYKARQVGLNRLAAIKLILAGADIYVISDAPMTRIFTILATLNALALLASVGLGLEFMWEREGGAAAPMGHQPLMFGWFAAHMIVGLATAVLTLFVHCLIFTYFLGTGRWVKEVARAYELPDSLLPKQTRDFKRRAFPPALFAMLSVIAVVAAGAGAQTSPESFWGLAHPLLSTVTLAVNAWAYVVEYQTVSANARVMDDVMNEVEKRRGAAGETGSSKSETNPGATEAPGKAAGPL